MVKISEIVPKSIADELSLTAGDRIVSVNNSPVRDFLDVLLAEKRKGLSLVVEKGNGELWQLDIEKEEGESCGFILEHPAPKRCGNNCIFCFVHQLPKGMRQTLYVKDEDYRFSYLYGAYITLSNLTESDIERIIEQKLSPLYVSVHAIDAKLRSAMLGREVPPILPILTRLVEGEIEIHTQIVVCPGVNDRAALTESVEKLSALYPGVKTLALVPVGLTEHRHKLPTLRLHTADEANALLDVLSEWQKRFMAKLSTRFVFSADEFYLKASRTFPGLAEYEELEQIENGVGMIALFRNEAEDVASESGAINCPVEFSVVTGKAFYPELNRFLERLSSRTGCQPHLYEIENGLFGSMVTVAGLISGSDLVSQLKGQKLGSALLVPDVMIREGANHFLDDLTPESVGAQLGCPVIIVPATPWGIVEAIEALVPD